MCCMSKLFLELDDSWQMSVLNRQVQRFEEILCFGALIFATIVIETKSNN